MRALERDGLITRTVHRSTPPRVEYALTDRRRTLLGPVLALAGWAIEHRGDVEASRRRYDEPAAWVAVPRRRGARPLVRPAVRGDQPAGRLRS